MIKGLKRVSVAVYSLEDALAFYRDALGLEVMAELDLPEHGLRIVRLALGATLIELMEPTDDAGPVAMFLDRRGEGLHHLTIDVDDIELEMRTMLARGIDLIDRQARDGPDGRVAFVHPRSTGGVLVEMAEERAQSSTQPESSSESQVEPRTESSTDTVASTQTIVQAPEQGTREEPDAR
jgi:methylmalonyl-CoA epimerase